MSDAQPSNVIGPCYFGDQAVKDVQEVLLSNGVHDTYKWLTGHHECHPAYAMAIIKKALRLMNYKRRP